MRSSAPRTVSMVKPPSNRRMNGPMPQEALLSLALPSRSALRPSMSRRLTSLPSVAPTVSAVHRQHDLRLRVVPFRFGMQADVGAETDRRHRLRFREHLGIRADAHFHVLRPGAALDELLLELFRFRRAGLDGRQVGADVLQQRAAQRVGAAGVAAGLLFDHAFQQADGEGHAAGLDRLHVARRQQARSLRGSVVGQRVIDQRFHAAQRLARRAAREGGGIVAVQQVGHGIGLGGDVEHFTVAHDHHARAVDVAGAPDAAYQQGVRQVGRQVRRCGRMLEIIFHGFSYVS
jgi:hypothetical protein